MRIWRASTTLGALREEVRAYAVQVTVKAGVRRPRARLGAVAGGVSAIGERVLYFTPDVDVQERDVIEIVSGPDSGRFEVDAPVTRPRGHHAEVTARVWAGVLP